MKGYWIAKNKKAEEAKKIGSNEEKADLGQDRERPQSPDQQEPSGLEMLT